MFETILALASAALSIWASKEKTKYSDQLGSLQEQYYAEYNKPVGERSDAALDNLSFQLRVLAGQLSAEIGASNAKA